MLARSGVIMSGCADASLADLIHTVPIACRWRLSLTDSAGLWTRRDIGRAEAPVVTPEPTVHDLLRQAPPALTYLTALAVDAAVRPTGFAAGDNEQRWQAAVRSAFAGKTVPQSSRGYRGRVPPRSRPGPP